MKQLLALGSVLLVLLASCTKTNTVTVTDVVNDTTTLTVTIRDTTTLKDTLGSNFDYITAHTWMYNAYYIGYVDSNHLGTLQYQRGAAGNLMNFDNARTTYNPNGSITELDENGGSTPGVWAFGNNQQTLILEQNVTGTYNATVVRMDASHFYWYYTAVDGTVRYGQYITAQ
jgi:hypothetical protein